MKKIFAIAWKDAIIRFASSSELLFFIILPIVFTFLLAGGTPSGDDDNRIPFDVVDEANTAVPALIEACKVEQINIETIEEISPPFDDVFVKLIEKEGDNEKVF